MTTSVPIAISDPPNFLQQLLDQQSQLTAVERFSLAHDSDLVPESRQAASEVAVDKMTGELGPTALDAPSQAQYYRALLPSAQPQPGEQYSFEVNLDSCSGCKSCVVACHTLNGLDEDESWRRVGTLVIGDVQPRVQHVTTACHHCADPGCLNGCPVKAYDKDPLTGIVRHLDDQCIGCKYCTMMCPYEVPKYNPRLGIVRKCDMCHQRLAVGEAPACVQACPNEAIAIRLVETQGLKRPADHRLSPNAPLSSITIPSTRYVGLSSIAMARASAQDDDLDHPAESHWPLALMLVATQCSIALLFVERVVDWFGLSPSAAVGYPSFTLAAAVTAGCLSAAGLQAAAFHLGQPLRAWRVFLGLRTSWLSREAVLFGNYMGLLGLAIGLMVLPNFRTILPVGLAESIPNWLADSALWTALVIGLLSAFSSGMIYIATRRQLWRGSRTFGRMLASGLCLGLVAAGTLLSWLSSVQQANSVNSTNSHPIEVPWLSASLWAAGALVLLAKIVWEWTILLGKDRLDDSDHDRRSRRLAHGPLHRLSVRRMVSGCAACLLCILAALSSLGWADPALQLTGTLVALAGFLAMSVGEVSERLLYFSSVVHDRMPGTMP